MNLLHRAFRKPIPVFEPMQQAKPRHISYTLLPKLTGEVMIDIKTILMAIEKRRVLSFIYKSEQRTADPYILGYDGKGQLMLSAAQRSGARGTGFRTFKVDGLSALQMSELHFSGSHPDYYRHDPYFERVLGQI